MRKTERKHWQNGHQVRGGYYHILAFSFWKYAIMIGFAHKGHRKISIDFYKLI